MEFFIEVLLTLFGDVLAAFFTSVFDGRRPATPERQVARFFAYAVIGVLAGWVSVMLHAQHVLSNPTAQRAWLLVSPIAAASFVFVFHWIFYPRERRGWPMAHAAVLAAAFTAWRFFSI